MRRIILLTLALLVLNFFLIFSSWTQSVRPDVDLGTARYPSAAGAPGSGVQARTTTHVWQEDPHGADYRLAFAHGSEAIAGLTADHEGLGRRFQFHWQGTTRFQWTIPPDCVGREWTCIYSEVLARSTPDLEPVIERIEAGFAAETWTTTQAARWLLAFVQQIPYRLPTTHAFGVLPPALVASEDWGDCDSKSLLLIHLLERIGIHALLITSEAHAHALVGIDVPMGTTGGYRHRGREYAWAETTTAGAPLGWIHPTLRLPNDWRVIPIR